MTVSTIPTIPTIPTLTTAAPSSLTAADATPFGVDPGDVARHAVTRTRRHDAAAIPTALRAEWLKVSTLRSNRGILAATPVIGVLLSWILATFVENDPQTHLAFTIGETFIFSTWLSTVLATIVGALMFTAEVQHGTMATAVAAQPARWVTVAAKSAVAACFGLAMGVLGMIGGFGGAVLGGLERGDTSGMAATAMWGLLLTTLAPLLGLGVGMVLRHSAASVSILLVWALVVENLVRTLVPAKAARFMPFSTANGLLGIESATDTPETIAVALTRVHDALLFSGYTTVILAIGTVLLYRRDTN